MLYFIYKGDISNVYLLYKTRCFDVEFVIYRRYYNGIVVMQMRYHDVEFDL